MTHVTPGSYSPGELNSMFPGRCESFCYCFTVLVRDHIALLFSSANAFYVLARALGSHVSHCDSLLSPFLSFCLTLSLSLFHISQAFMPSDLVNPTSTMLCTAVAHESALQRIVIMLTYSLTSIMILLSLLIISLITKNFFFMF